MKNIDNVKQLLKKYDLKLPILPREQRKIYRSKRRTLAVILGRNEKSTFMISSAVRFYYIMRRLDIQVTLVSAMRGAVFASVMALVMIAGGSFIISQNYIYHQGGVALNDVHKTGVIAASREFRIKRNGAEQVALKAPDLILAGDEIFTGDSSLLLQFDNGALVKILKESSVFVARLNPRHQFDLKSGGIITRIPELKEGSLYEIHTPDSVVSVKGTEFGVLYKNGKTEVFVKQGTVKVKHVVTGVEYEVAEGDASEVNGNKNISMMTEDELLIMQGFATLWYVESISTKSPDELEILNEKLTASDEQVKIKPQKAKMLTLSQLKVKHGKLDEVTIYNGKKYTGVIISRGVSYKILTPAGIVLIPAEKVKATKVID